MISTSKESVLVNCNNGKVVNATCKYNDTTSYWDGQLPDSCDISGK